MKNLLVIIFILVTGKAFGQTYSVDDTAKKYWNNHAPVIAAKEAYKYVGKRVILKDSLYSAKVTSDSTLVCQMGEEANTPRLTMVYLCPAQFRPVDLKFFNTFKRYQMTIYGIITGTRNAPVLFLKSTNNMTIENRKYPRSQ